MTIDSTQYNNLVAQRTFWSNELTRLQNIQTNGEFDIATKSYTIQSGENRMSSTKISVFELHKSIDYAYRMWNYYNNILEGTGVVNYQVTRVHR